MTLSRPEVYNALHIEAHFELNMVFDDFAADPEQLGSRLSPAPATRPFCARQHLKWQAVGGKRGWDRAGFAGSPPGFDFDKPIIRQLSLTVFCDWRGRLPGRRWAGHSSSPSDNVTICPARAARRPAALAGAVPRQRLAAAYRILKWWRLACHLTPGHHHHRRPGRAWSSVSSTGVPQSDLMATAERWADTICKNSPMSIRASKQAIERGPRGIARTSYGRAAGIPGRQGDGSLAGLYRGTEGVFRKARPEMAGQVADVSCLNPRCR